MLFPCTLCLLILGRYQPGKPFVRQSGQKQEFFGHNIYLVFSVRMSLWTLELRVNRPVQDAVLHKADIVAVWVGVDLARCDGRAWEPEF